MLTLFAVRDVKADAFERIIEVPSKGLAIRAFMEAALAPSSPIGKYPEDYMLYTLGTYDPNTGSIVGLPLPELVMTASEAIAQAKRPQVAGEEVKA